MREGKMLKVYTLTMDGVGYTAENMDGPAAEIETAEPGTVFTITVSEMPEEEYDALPEFDGF